MNTQDYLKQLKEKRGKLHFEMKKLNDAAVEGKRGFNADDWSKWEKMGNDFQELEKEIERQEQIMEQDARLAKVDLEREETRRKGESREEAVVKESLSFRDWFLKQPAGGSPVEIRLLEKANEGAYAVPVGFMNKVEEAMLAFGGIYANADVYKTNTGNDITYPTINDTGNSGAVLAEATTIGNSVDPTLGSLTLKAYKISSTPILVSHEMLQDNAIELENRIAVMIATRIMRGANALWTTGAGTTTIQGVVTGATSSSVAPAATSFTYNNLVDLMHSVDPEYRTNGKWMFNDSTLKAIRKLVDGDSRPLWQPNVILGEPPLLLGKPYIVNQSMASVGANAKSALFGDFSKYLIREVKNPLFLRLKERYADLGEEAFIMFKRFDGQVVDAGTHPIKYWTHAAS
jgi:HK97 family phage major capsid protein